MTEPELLIRKLQREKSARQQAEVILEQKSRELFQANEAIQKSNQKLAETNARLQQDIAERLRAERALIAKELEARLLHRAASMASDTQSFEVALSHCLEMLGNAFDWTVGHAYIANRHKGSALIPTGIWYEREPMRHLTFRRLTEKLFLRPGVGLPGRVLALGEPVWIADVQKDSNFPRVAACRESGLRGGFAFPIMVAGKCAAILEFFREDVAAEDEGFLQIIRSVSQQLGRVLERKGAEEALRASEQRIRLIIDTALDAVVSIDAGGIINDWSTHAQVMFGRSHEQAIGRHVSELIVLVNHSGAGARDLQKLITESGAEILNRRTELRALGRDGEEFPIEIAVAPVPLGDTTGYSIFLRDVSDRHRAAAEREHLHSQLMAVSRSAGMAEVATGVLHNVGNVLNSVNVSATLAADRLRASRVTNLARAIGMMNDHESDLSQFLTTDEKGRQLPGYLTKLADHLAKEQSDVLAELTSLERNVEHIKQVVSMQQAHARIAHVIEEVAPCALLEDAIRLNISALERHRVPLSRVCATVPMIHTEKHKVLQILINLISNACNAMESTPLASRRLTLHVQSVEGSAGRVRIQVVDTGMGIAPENLERIFAHGFTTRKDGHGFGLHTAVLAAQELGGALSVHSDGLGKGAAFTLELPPKMPIKETLRESAGISSAPILAG